MRMMDEREYYEELGARLAESTLMADFDEPRDKDDPVPAADLFKELYSLLDRVEEKYEFDLQKIVLPNYIHFTLWQRSCGGKQNLEAIRAAVSFVVFCCLVDKILDSGRFSAEYKEIVCKKLDTSLFFSSSAFDGEGFAELDTMLNEIRLFLTDGQISEENAEWIRRHIQRAFDSECFMYRSRLQNESYIAPKQLCLLIDKSVQFERIAFLIAAPDRISDQTKETAEHIGKLFWLIDDLWDLPEDIEQERLNSLLFFDMPREMTVPDRVEMVRNKLGYYTEQINRELTSVGEFVSEPLLRYLRWELRKWSRHGTVNT